MLNPRTSSQVKAWAGSETTQVAMLTANNAATFLARRDTLQDFINGMHAPHMRRKVRTLASIRMGQERLSGEAAFASHQDKTPQNRELRRNPTGKPKSLWPVAIPVDSKRGPILARGEKGALGSTYKSLFPLQLKAERPGTRKVQFGDAGGKAEIADRIGSPSSHVHLGLGILAAAVGSRLIHAVLSDCANQLVCANSHGGSPGM